MIRVLLAAPVRQDPEVLAAFLAGVTRLVRDGLQVDARFVDDNEDPASSTLLAEFGLEGATVTVVPAPGGRFSYRKDESGHHWDLPLMARLARVRDSILAATIQGGYHHLFLVDADLILHPRTLIDLVATGLDLVSGLFWTRWTDKDAEEPQVWLRGQYRLYDSAPQERLQAADAATRSAAFFRQVRSPGVYVVGGLGAATLISSAAIRRGLSYAEIPSLDCYGEDRHFSVRAQALGMHLHVDTRWPALHLYRRSDLQRLPAFLAGERWRELEVMGAEVARRAVVAWGDRHWTLPATGFSGDGFHPLLAEALRSDAAGTCDQAARDRLARVVDVVECVPRREGEVLIVEGAARYWTTKLEHTSTETAGFRVELDVHAGKLHAVDIEFGPPPSLVRTPAPVRPVKRVRVLLSMLVRNERGRYLERAIAAALPYIDEALILDDASDDGTPEIAAECLRGLPHRIVRLPTRGFHDEWRLRTLQWQLAAFHRPDWILNLDADEILEPGPATELRARVRQDHADAVALRLHDFWDEEHYRDDRWWSAHHRPAIFLARWFPGIDTSWRETPQHCGRWPLAVFDRPALVAETRLCHMGWARQEDRRAKHARYQRLDPEGRFGVAEQYDSILDPAPNLVRFAPRGA